MTHEQETSLRNFESLVRQLMMAYEQERRANKELREALQRSQQTINNQEQQLQQAKREYDTLRTARMLEVCNDDVNNARSRISKLIREVDKCIALINA